jgi:hypothetical protein
VSASESSRFDQRVQAILEGAVKRAGATAPELEGALVLALYRFPDQRAIPAIWSIGVDRPLATPDQLARLAALVAEAQVWLAGEYVGSILDLRRLESELARALAERGDELARQDQARTGEDQDRRASDADDSDDAPGPVS